MNRIITLVFFLLVNFAQLVAQDTDLQFRRISPPGGYSFQAIHSFIQDKYGYMWMGGFEGLIRYDSKEIKRFTYKPGKKNGIPSNTVNALAFDNSNKLWIATDKGLCIFSNATRTFQLINYNYENNTPANKQIFSIQFDGDGRLWIADKYHLGYLDENNHQMIRINNGLDAAPRLIYRDEQNRLWVGADNGAVYMIHPHESRVEKIIQETGSLVRTISSTSTSVWVGYQEHGARVYDLNGNLQYHYDYPENPEFNFKSASIRKICRDTRGQVWIGSYYGLFMAIGNKLIRFDHDHFEGLPHNSIFDIYEDRQGGIWIGTWSGGIAYLHHSDNKFNNFRHSKEPGSISDNMISSFAQTPDGTLYVGTELFGLNKFNRKERTFTPVFVRKSKAVLDTKALVTDRYGGLWIASAFNGVFYRPLQNSEFIHFPAGPEDGKHVSAKEIYSICPCDSGVWIGTNLGGLNFYNFKTKKIDFRSKQPPFNQLLEQNLRSLTIDHNDNLWVGTLTGLYKINLTTLHLTKFCFDAIPPYKTRSQTFYHISEQSDKNIWIGTGGDGIYIYHPDADSLSYFDANGLLKGKDVYGIVEGMPSNLWITTNDGLILYNSKEQTARRFVINDGIQGNLFNPNAIFKDNEGNLYFGGTNGFSIWEPKPIKTNNRPPNILLNSILVNNREIVPVPTSINTFKAIRLNPNERTLAFHFSADNYLLPDKNEFTYRLRPFVNDWVFAGNSGTASFINVPAGTYTFEVKACNNDGIWNPQPAVIEINIAEYWYRTRLAVFFYVLLFLTISFLIFRFYRDRLRLKKALLIEKMQHQHEEQINEMKLKFFTNISHEFRTPLTLINGPIEKLLKAGNLNAEQLSLLETAKRNSSRLLRLINQILDLRKAEKGLSKLNISNIEINNFTRSLIKNFAEEQHRKNISCTFSSEYEKLFIEADEEKLDKIIYNLLANAFKYTPENGTIEVRISAAENTIQNAFANRLSFGELPAEKTIQISISDNGPGIPGQDLPHIFKRFEQGHAQYSNGSGIGLNLCKEFTLIHRGVIIAQSTPGKGSCFSIQIPIKQKAQKLIYQEQIDNTIDSIPTSEKQMIRPEPTGEKVTILLVEDHHDLRNYIVNLLQEYYSILAAENGKQGFALLASNSVDLVISDVMMPEMDGFTLCQKIKSSIETSHIPVILLTALSSETNKITGLDRGADAYVLKPFNDLMLITQINNLLQQRKRIQENFSKKMLHSQPIEVGNLDNYFINKINSIIESNFNNEQFSVDFLASEIGLSRSQLHRKLKQLSNYSASEYITMLRIKKATALLHSQNYTIDEIAFQVGFNSHSYFSKCFKKIHGMTPKEYLKRHCKGKK